jgi:hypothetical protein
VTRTLLALLALAALASPVRGQEEACELGVIRRVHIDNNSVFDMDEVGGSRLDWAYRLANTLHIRTRDRFIRRELLFWQGECFDPFLIADSERVLRRLGFIADARVTPTRVDEDTWDVEVWTRDEWSTRLEISAEFENGVELRNVSLTEENLLGTGTQIGVFSNRDDAARTTGGLLQLNQAFGTQANVTLSAGETRVGSTYNVDVSYPFLGEAGRTAWRARIFSAEDYFQYSASTPEERALVLLPVEDKAWEVTVARRWGVPGNLTVAGLGLSREQVRFEGSPGSIRRIQGTNFGELLPPGPDDPFEVSDQTFFSSGTRINLLFGQRNIRFVERRGLDALKGITDLETGSDVSLTLSRTILPEAAEVVPEDLGVRFRFYAGRAASTLVSLMNVAVDGRQVFSDPFESGRTGWRDVIGEVDGLLYWQPSALPRHTVVGRLAMAGGWTMDRPYQLTLGGRTGVRGYNREAFPAGRTLVLNLEDRIYVGWPAPKLLDTGITLFADVGRGWAGDVPFGLDSGWRAAVGGGLRLSFPAGGRGVARIDLAWPIDPGGRSGSPVLRISLADLIGLAGGLEDGQLRRSRLLNVGPDSFAPRR